MADDLLSFMDTPDMSKMAAGEAQYASRVLSESNTTFEFSPKANPLSAKPKELKSTSSEEAPTRASADQTAGLGSLKHYPQPIFLLSKDFHLIETNMQGMAAIDKHWVSLSSSNQLHFISSENDKLVTQIITELLNTNKEDQYLGSRRFVLRSVDTLFRSFTLNRESKDNSNFILTIHSDLRPTENKVHCLAKAFGLSHSETQVIKMMIAGLKPKEIAFEMGLSLNTVRSHLRTLYAKMQVKDYNDALIHAVRLLA